MTGVAMILVAALAVVIAAVALIAGWRHLSRLK